MIKCCCYADCTTELRIEDYSEKFISLIIGDGSESLLIALDRKAIRRLRKQLKEALNEIKM